MESSPIPHPLTGETSTPPSRAQKIKAAMQILAATGVAIGLLAIFTVLKLPQSRMKAFIQGTLAAELAKSGIGLSAQESTFSMGLGIHYAMKGVTLSFPSPKPSIELDRLELSSRLASLIKGRLGASLELAFKRSGTLNATIEIRPNLKGQVVTALIDAQLAEIDLKKTHLLSTLAGLEAQGTLQGKVDLLLGMEDLNVSSGTLEFKLSKGQIDAQSLSGFQIPALPISTAVIQGRLDGAMLKLTQFEVGKKGNDDAVQGNLTGQLKLNKTPSLSTLDLIASFRFSEAVLKSFSILDAILTAGKQSDGTYQYKLGGTLASPYPTPVSSK
jgi:type II secretion system protein N